ncbi:MAG TPA: hypothetical protein DHU26_05200 [Spirochaetaceae bacterium]|nr:hypothetical protein [Spirochaetaceae bacterium]
MNKFPYTYALIGCGRISYKHIEAVLKNRDRLHLVAVCDPVVERANVCVGDYWKGVSDVQVSVYGDYREMLEKERPDICAIATAAAAHRKLVVCFQNRFNAIVPLLVLSRILKIESYAFLKSYVLNFLKKRRRTNH